MSKSSSRRSRHHHTQTATVRGCPSEKNARIPAHIYSNGLFGFLGWRRTERYLQGRRDEVQRPGIIMLTCSSANPESATTELASAAEAHAAGDMLQQPIYGLLDNPPASGLNQFTAI